MMKPLLIQLVNHDRVTVSYRSIPYSEEFVSLSEELAEDHPSLMARIATEATRLESVDLNRYSKLILIWTE